MFRGGLAGGENDGNLRWELGVSCLFFSGGGAEARSMEPYEDTEAWLRAVLPNESWW